MELLLVVDMSSLKWQERLILKNVAINLWFSIVIVKFGYSALFGNDENAHLFGNMFGGAVFGRLLNIATVILCQCMHTLPVGFHQTHSGRSRHGHEHDYSHRERAKQSPASGKNSHDSHRADRRNRGCGPAISDCRLTALRNDCPELALTDPIPDNLPNPLVAF